MALYQVRPNIDSDCILGNTLILPHCNRSRIGRKTKIVYFQTSLAGNGNNYLALSSVCDTVMANLSSLWLNLSINCTAIAMDKKRKILHQERKFLN